MGPKSRERDWLALARETIDVEAQGLAHVRDRLDDNFVMALEMMANCKGRVVVTGIGKSGLVGRKIAATLSSTGTPSFFLHPVEGAHGDLGMLRPEDVALAISNSGETDELNAILPTIRAAGVRIIALTGCADSTMGRMAEAIIDSGVEREACTLNLAPTASTTATLALGDALAICLIEWKSFKTEDFKRRHPGGALGQRLSLSVADLMHVGNIPVANESTDLGHALDALTQGGLGALALTAEDGLLTGILTDGDVRRALCSGSPDLQAPASAFMTRQPSCAGPQSTAAEVLDLMEEKAITVMPIVDGDGRLTGMIHLHDLLGKGLLKFSG
ncbi:KpsF/GutQ family sugar-phosphate isomerase [Desulfovibrio ferrophilus]|uniref:KpsF/GutQ family protein n=1 Tax=Desulfovibrio ferrophilus TaxID=241368 RepID=A0A2Z6AV02_9BACT|nr:KpsF/GutQ family sugar-phosphate isomerase [Desulfovibrio ferrophilus]BBD07069.1 KpsF/GutQ family protein [Desulfovibrio ferrophilus]